MSDSRPRRRRSHVHADDMLLMLVQGRGASSPAVEGLQDFGFAQDWRSADNFAQVIAQARTHISAAPAQP